MKSILNIRLLKVLAVGTIAIATAASSARAAATLKVTLTSIDPVTNQPTVQSTTVDDNDAADKNNIAGIVSFTASLGSWTVTTTNAVTKPVQGTAAAPSMDLHIVAVSTGAGSITAEFSDDSYGPTNSVASTSMSGFIDADNSVTYSTKASGANLKFQGSGLTASQPVGPGNFAANTGSANINFPAPYALTQSVTISHAGAGTSSVDCALYVPRPTGAIGDFVWRDLNGNGIQDSGEPGIDGVTVTLKDGNGVVIGTTATAANGFYQFTGLAAGTYSVIVDTASVPLIGLTASPSGAGTPSTDSNPNPATVVFATDGSSDQTIDFGFYARAQAPSGQIGNFVWKDLNQDGIQQMGEPGIDGVKVILKDGADNVITSTTTAGGGAYLFTGLMAGTYKVTVDTSSPALLGYIPTLPNAPGSTFANDSNLNPSTVVLVSDNSVDLTVDFGYISSPNGSIGDFVWKDLNGDGIQDADEPGIPGVTVKLYQGINLLATTTTDIDGLYLFTKLPAGTYTVSVDLASPALGGTTPTAVNALGSTTANDGNPNPATVVLPLNTSSDTSIDFGFVPNPTGQIGNFVWKDVNHNGIQDAGEPGINNVTVTLKDGFGTVLAVTMTSGNGAYLFSGLTAGNYIVQVDGTDPDLGILIPTTGSAPGSNAASDSNVNPAPVTLATDSSVDLTIDFGFYAPGCGCIGDYVWKDLDCDGVQDCNEPGIKGVAVKLYWNNMLVGSEVTDSCGHYMFCGLWAGTYTVVIDNNQSALSGLSPTKVGGTTNKAYDSGTSPGTVTLATNKSCDLTVDFGFKKTPTTCPITTCNPASWGNKSNSFCQSLDDCFDKVYPCGLTLGSGRCLKFTSCQSIKNFLPCYGSGTCIRQTYCNPSTQIGCLVGNVVCLRLAADCSKAGITGPGLVNCKLKTGKFCGWSVGQLLALGESCLSGSRLPWGCSYKDLSDACAMVNDNYNLGANCGNLAP